MTPEDAMAMLKEYEHYFGDKHPMNVQAEFNGELVLQVAKRKKLEQRNGYLCELLELFRNKHCFCEMGTGNPKFFTHTPNCEAIRSALGK